MIHDPGRLVLPRRRGRPFAGRTSTVVIAASMLGLLAAACGGSPKSQVAQLGSTTNRTQNSSPTAGSSGSPASAGPTTSQTLAYTQCMRSHGVPTFPDPDSSGQISKTQVVSARQQNPSRFDSADAACRHLLPNGGNGETQAEITLDWTAFRKFARCMRTHGASHWPDPTSRSATDRRPTFNLQGTGLYPVSSTLRTTAEQCGSQLHLGGLPAAAGPPPTPTG